MSRYEGKKLARNRKIIYAGPVDDIRNITQDPLGAGWQLLDKSTEALGTDEAKSRPLLADGPHALADAQMIKQDAIAGGAVQGFTEKDYDWAEHWMVARGRMDPISAKLFLSQLPGLAQASGGIPFVNIVPAAAAISNQVGGDPQKVLEKLHQLAEVQKEFAAYEVGKQPGDAKPGHIFLLVAAAANGDPNAVKALNTMNFASIGLGALRGKEIGVDAVNQTVMKALTPYHEEARVSDQLMDNYAKIRKNQVLFDININKWKTDLTMDMYDQMQGWYSWLNSTLVPFLGSNNALKEWFVKNGVLIAAGISVKEHVLNSLGTNSMTENMMKHSTNERRKMKMITAQDATMGVNTSIVNNDAMNNMMSGLQKTQQGVSSPATAPIQNGSQREYSQYLQEYKNLRTKMDDIIRSFQLQENMLQQSATDVGGAYALDPNQVADQATKLYKMAERSQEEISKIRGRLAWLYSQVPANELAGSKPYFDQLSTESEQWQLTVHQTTLKGVERAISGTAEYKCNQMAAAMGLLNIDKEKLKLLQSNMTGYIGQLNKLNEVRANIHKQAAQAYAKIAGSVGSLSDWAKQKYDIHRSEAEKFELETMSEMVDSLGLSDMNMNMLSTNVASSNKFREITADVGRDGEGTVKVEKEADEETEDYWDELLPGLGTALEHPKKFRKTLTDDIPVVKKKLIHVESV